LKQILKFGEPMNMSLAWLSLTRMVKTF